MADIKHLVLIQASAESVYRAITEQAGLAGWWTTQTVAEPRVGSVAEFTFGNRYRNRMRVVDLVENERVEWKCLEGDEQWIGTSFVFELEPEGGRTIVRFTHGDWHAMTDFYAHCNYHWGFYLRSLKSYCETGEGEPFSENAQ